MWNCKHCNNEVEDDENNCYHCGNERGSEPILDNKHDDDGPIEKAEETSAIADSNIRKDGIVVRDWFALFKDRPIRWALCIYLSPLFGIAITYAGFYEISGLVSKIASIAVGFIVFALGIGAINVGTKRYKENT